MFTVNVLDERSVRWKSPSADFIEVVIRLTEAVSDKQGKLPEPVRVKNGLKLTIQALVNGKGIGAEGFHEYASPRPPDKPAGSIGGRLPLNKEQVRMVRAELRQVAAHPKWAAHLAELFGNAKQEETISDEAEPDGSAFASRSAYPRA